ncbi:MAG: hypothetical protein AAF645_18020 [Myxococcota bacterium]
MFRRLMGAGGWRARIVLLVPLLGAPSECGLDSERGEGEPCTRRDDCVGDLECTGGVCTLPNTEDAGTDGGSDIGADE